MNKESILTLHRKDGVEIQTRAHSLLGESVNHFYTATQPKRDPISLNELIKGGTRRWEKKQQKKQENAMASEMFVYLLECFLYSLNAEKVASASKF